MLITRTFKYCIHKAYSDIEQKIITQIAGGRMVVMEFDECGSTLSLSVHNPHTDRGFDLQPISNATLESWNDNVLKFGGYCGIRWTNVYIELDSQDGKIKRITTGDPNECCAILTNEKE